jgi:HSP90 family molecular chaperone
VQVPLTRKILDTFQELLDKQYDQYLVTLKDYVGRMKSDQEQIFYLTGESRSVSQIGASNGGA